MIHSRNLFCPSHRLEGDRLCGVEVGRRVDLDGIDQMRDAHFMLPSTARIKVAPVVIWRR